MATLAESAAALAGRPVDLIPAPRAVTDAEFDAAFLTRYAAVASAVGFAPPELEVQRFKALCAEHGICCYDRATVKAYLDQKYGGAFKKTVEHVWNGGFAAFVTIEEAVAMERAPRTVIRRRATWGWRPLKPNAKLQKQRTEVGWIAGPDSDQVITTGQGYTKPIPLPVLLTAQQIREVAPSATFYASDEIWEADVRPVRDPFLAVEIGGQFFIVERWDEPGFKP